MIVTESTNRNLAQFYRERGNWTQVYVDASGDVEDPRGTAASRRRNVRKGLEEAGAPVGDMDAIEDVLVETPGVASPVCRFILVREGTVELSEVLPGPPVASDRATFGPVPDLLPVLQHRPGNFSYLVVEAGRDGGEVRLYRTDSVAPITDTTVEGRTDSLHKVQTGGWSHARYQHHSEEIWKHNAGELAVAIDELVREHRPRLLVLAGDVRASQLLQEQLSVESRRVLSTVSTYTRPDGASDDALNDHLAEQLDALLADDVRVALERLAGEQGRGEGTAEAGVGAVVHALQQGQVETVLLDPQRLRERNLLALDGEPWVATAPEETFGAAVLGSVPADVAIVRAALLEDATVLFAPGKEFPGGADVAALLRWPTGPAPVTA